MKQFYSQLNYKLYYIVLIMNMGLMTMGLLVVNSRNDEITLGYILHLVLVVILSAFLFIYPKFETRVLRIIIITTISAYFYTLFFVYPETSSTIIFLCLIPAISILFFDSKLFYFSLISNGALMALTFTYIMFIDKANKYPFIKIDVTGNIINFIGSQVFIFFLFSLYSARIKKQQMYFEQIQQSERLKTTGQLAAAVAHEIRNPLTVVKGFLQFYENDPSIHKDDKKNFAVMINELNSAEHVISQFLTNAKPENNQKLELVNINECLHSVTDLLLSYGVFHQNKIELNVQENVYISANVIEFKQLFTNLIKNAIEVSDRGESVRISAKRKENYVEISVRDTGCGMSEEELKLLGTPFYSLKSKGTGLGLMICFNIVEKYKGTIRFNSVKGNGTTVTIQFPYYDRKDVLW